MSINTIINAINLYYSLNSTIRAFSTYLLGYMNIKVSHVTISKWTKNLYLGYSDEWDTDETVVKINAQVCGINYTHQEKVNWSIKY